MIKKIEGLDEAIELFEEQPKPMVYQNTILRAARAYAELQKGDMVIVPREPTEEMMKSGRDANVGPRSSVHGYIYEAMLGAVE